MHHTTKEINYKNTWATERKHFMKSFPKLSNLSGIHPAGKLRRLITTNDSILKSKATCGLPAKFRKSNIFFKHT